MYCVERQNKYVTAFSEDFPASLPLPFFLFLSSLPLPSRNSTAPHDTEHKYNKNT